MTVLLKFTGGAELEATLLRLGQKEAKKIGRQAIRKAGKLILEAARDNVHVDQGKLKKALRLRVDTSKYDKSLMVGTIDLKFDGTYRPAKTKRARYSYQIGSNPKVYGFFEEFGTNDTPPHPYLRPAWDLVGGQTSLRIIGAALGTGIEGAVGFRNFGKPNVTGRST